MAGRQALDNGTNRWSQSSAYLTSEDNGGLFPLDEEIYTMATGGFDGTCNTSSIRMFEGGYNQFAQSSTNNSVEYESIYDNSYPFTTASVTKQSYPDINYEQYSDTFSQGYSFSPNLSKYLPPLDFTSSSGNKYETTSYSTSVLPLSIPERPQAAMMSRSYSSGMGTAYSSGHGSARSHDLTTKSAHLIECSCTARFTGDKAKNVKGNAMRHVKSQTAKFQCVECGRKFNRVDNLQQHRNTRHK